MNKDKKLGYGDLVLKKCVINGCKVHQLSNFDDHTIKNIKQLTIYKCEIPALLFHYFTFISAFTKGMKGMWECRTSRTTLFILQNKFSIVVLKKKYFEQFFYTLNFLCWTLKWSWGTRFGSKVTVGTILKNLNFDDSCMKISQVVPNIVLQKNV